MRFAIPVFTVIFKNDAAVTNTNTNRVNVLPEIDDVVDWVENWVVDGNVDGVGLSEAPFRIPFTHGNI